MSKLIFFFTLFACFSAWSSEEVPSQKVSVTGAIFTLNQTYPELRNAYEDPSGLIWGDLVIENNKVLQTDAASAEAYCKSIGTRLPTLEEYRKLGEYLGRGTKGGYSPYTQDRNDFVLFGLPFYWYWTSTPYWFSSKKFQYIFWGESGATQDGSRRSKGGAIHCVVRPDTTY